MQETIKYLDLIEMGLLGDIDYVEFRTCQEGCIDQKLPGKECGVCGAPDCRTFAEDVADGRLQIDDCMYLKYITETGDSNAGAHLCAA